MLRSAFVVVSLLTLTTCGATSLFDTVRGSLRSCSSNADCPTGETCRYSAGCPGSGLCSDSPCSNDAIPSCLCDGHGTLASSSCPPAPFQARGNPGPFDTVYCKKAT